MAMIATKWSREKVISAILERAASGKEISLSSIRKDDTSLRGAIERYFGNMRNALIEAKINPEEVEVQTRWTREKIKHEFLSVLGDISSISQLHRKHRGLDHAIRKHYGTYESLCAELGLSVDVIKRQVREWKREDLLQVLREMREECLPLNITNVESRFPTVHNVSIRCFGSYENALSEIGESLDDHICEMKYSSFLGKKFERVLYEMFSSLGYSYLYQKRLVNGKIMPDFIDQQNNLFIDAKLSSWTVFHSDSLTKYLPHCDGLLVVYLRGKDIKHSIEKLELRHISFYYEELRKNGLEHFIEKFHKIELSLDEQKTRDTV